MISYQVGDGALTAEAFLKLVNRVWPGEYDLERTEAALARTLNITARDGGELVGCLRILSDGCYFGTITELLVLPTSPRAGKCPYPALFRRAARTGTLLRAKWMPQKPAIL